MFIVFGFIALFVLAISIGVTYEILGKRHATQEFPPPGKLVDIGGRRIQLDCRGTGSPTVIFESGLDIEGSLSWSLVHDAIAKTTRACAYSRAGIMWSDPHDAPQNGISIAKDLHATLKNAGEKGPFVLVGHSLGGPYIMTYTKYFGADVAGLVFVDASHPDQLERFKSAGFSTPMPNKMQLMYKIGAALNWTGVVRAVATMYKRMPRFPMRDDQAVKAYASTSLGSMLKENDSLEQTLLESGTFRQLGHRPVFVLTAMAPLSPQVLTQIKITAKQAEQRQQLWVEMQDEQAAWSSQSRHQLVSDAGHYIQLDRPDAVIRAVQWVVKRVRANQKS